MIDKLKVKLIDDSYLDKDGKILPQYKFKINHPALKIQNSKFIGNPKDKFETMLFLPEGEGRKGEGGLRTKGLFKFSYENLMVNDECLIMNESKKDNISNKNKIQNPTSKIQHSKKWYIVDYDGNPVEPAPDYIQEKINTYINNTSPKTEHPTSNIQNSTSNIQNSTSNIQNSTSNIQNSTSNIQHPKFNI